MNNKSLIITNAIMGIAIAILFILHFTKENPEVNPSMVDNTTPYNSDVSNNTATIDQLSNNSITSSNGDSISIANFTNLKIAFVNSDTVAEYYHFSKKLKTELLKKQTKAESQIKKKYNEYQKLVAEYQKVAEIMGQNEAAEKAQTIGLLEQEIMQLEQSLSQNLANQELKASSDYITITDQYLQKIGAVLGYDYILSYRVGGHMLYANPSLDITQEVIKYLNQEYKK